jgi:hypothetical protein
VAQDGTEMARDCGEEVIGIVSQTTARALTLGFVLERVTGIEPALSAWEADVLPLNYTRRGSLIRARWS